MAAKGLARRRRSVPVAAATGAANVPAWVRKRGEEYVAEFLARREERRQERIADLIERAPPAVGREGPDAVREWAEEWDATDPRLQVMNAEGNPRAPLPISPRD